MQALRTIRHEIQQQLLATPVVARAAAGNMSVADYTRYLTNVWHYASQSSRVIGLAASALVNSHPPLAQYLFHHANEELGHDAWAAADLAHLGMSDAELHASRPTFHCEAMIAYEFYLARGPKPVALFAWLYVLESMGDDLGGKIAQAIAQDEHMAGALRFLAGHGEADVAHTADLTAMIEQHIHGSDMDEVVHAAGVVRDLYVGLFQDIG